MGNCKIRDHSLQTLWCSALPFNYIKSYVINIMSITFKVMLCFLFLVDSCMFLLQYSLAYACLKLVNYSFFFWLPFYLSNNFGWKEAEADQLSIWYDVGGIIGMPVHIFFQSKELVTDTFLMGQEIWLQLKFYYLFHSHLFKTVLLVNNQNSLKMFIEWRTQPKTGLCFIGLSFLSSLLMDQFFCLGKGSGISLHATLLQTFHDISLALKLIV